jgi:hyperosmotically inducible periplasmic protein
MRTNLVPGTLLVALAFGTIAGCSANSKAPDVAGQLRNSLDQAGLRDVTVSQDRDKGVVTLAGTTRSDSDRAQAESIAKGIASGEVVSDQIAVRTPGDESGQKTAEGDLDKDIGENFDAVLAEHKLNHRVSYDVKNGVITLKGHVESESRRAAVEKWAAAVPNVRQVVNELDVKNRKASSTHGCEF